MNSAARSVVLGIKIDDEPLSGVIGELYGLAILVGEGKIWKRIAGGKYRVVLSILARLVAKNILT